MASKGAHPLDSSGARQVEIAGSFPLTSGATAAPAAATTYGVGFTITKPAQAEYVVTLDRLYPRLVSATASIQTPETMQDTAVSIGPVTAPASGTGFQIKLMVAVRSTGVQAAAETADVDARINFRFTMAEIQKLA